MDLITWTEEMSVGVKALDDDHKMLIEMMNKLNDGILAGQSNLALEDVVESLVRYTRLHFAREERLFAQTGYPAARRTRRSTTS